LCVSAPSLTETKIVLGTPHYMAPELFESSSQASIQSDLYAVGAVGYFLLTGCTVFGGETVDAICMAHLTRPPVPPSQRVAAPIDARLEAALLACLAKDRDARPRNAAALLALIERCPCAHGWTSDDANRWWTARQGEVLRLRLTPAAAESVSELRPAPAQAGP
jgi:serine/threonine protein kinase